MIESSSNTNCDSDIPDRRSVASIGHWNHGMSWVGWRLISCMKALEMDEWLGSGHRNGA